MVKVRWGQSSEISMGAALSVQLESLVARVESEGPRAREWVEEAPNPLWVVEARRKKFEGVPAVGTA